ncbi:MAG TPA: protein kinase [Thermoanaerobaculia bacterium]|nr:protein kinase [Thermoanaerobaculia bacterium]
MQCIRIVESGTRLGPYEIAGRIGAGGMGEVYRAIDTRLDRTVAIKILPLSLSEDPRRLARLKREAKAISSLTHPNICRLYDVGRDDGIEFLVMEHLDGETLADRLVNGPLSLAKALRTGVEIASALAEAHRQQIVHRDVKPSNIVLTPSGAKLIDFGLARDDAPSDTTETQRAITEEGSAPGTLAYMAPEQLEGRPADSRSDLWGLGIVLFEMVAGRHPFEGTSRAELISGILTRDPDLDAIRIPALRHVIARCLAREPDDRWQSARDAAEQLRWIGEGGAPKDVQPGRRRATLISLIVLVSTLAGFAVWKISRAKRPSLPSSLSIAFPAGARLRGFDIPRLAISPDGRQVVFSILRERIELVSRPLDRFDQIVLARGGDNPVFSPDGEWIAFAHGLKLLKIRAAGGPVTELGDLPQNPRGIAWGPDGSIYFALGYSGGLARISADGSGYRELTTPDESADENSHRWPDVLPDGKHVLFTIRTSRISSFDEARIAVLSLETGRWRTVLEGGYSARYLSTGHLVYVQSESLTVIPFDLKTMSVRGPAVPLIRDVMCDETTGAAQYAVADQAGSLIYVAGGSRTYDSEFLIVDRQGAVTRSLAIPRFVTSFRVSPDAKQLAIQVAAANDDVWTWDLEREILTRVSFESGDEWYPSWTPDGGSLLFNGRRGLLRKPVDGSGTTELLVEARTTNYPSPSPDGRQIAYGVRHPSTGNDIWILPLDGERRPRVFANTVYDEVSAMFSPDGKWVAYWSDESGAPEIYLRPVSGSGRIQVSSGGGMLPLWSRDGRWLYYRWAAEFFAVPVVPGERPSIGKPQLMFRITEPTREWDVLGEQFILLKAAEQPALASGINIVPNWFDEVKARAPRK